MEMLDEESKESVISRHSSFDLAPQKISQVDSFISRTLKDIAPT